MSSLPLNPMTDCCISSPQAGHNLHPAQINPESRSARDHQCYVGERTLYRVFEDYDGSPSAVPWNGYRRVDGIRWNRMVGFSEDIKLCDTESHDPGQCPMGVVESPVHPFQPGTFNIALMGYAPCVGLPSSR